MLIETYFIEGYGYRGSLEGVYMTKIFWRAEIISCLKQDRKIGAVGHSPSSFAKILKASEAKVV